MIANNPQRSDEEGREIMPAERVTFAKTTPIKTNIS